MARQRGIKPITGTIGDITYYKLHDKYYSRAKSTLDKKTVLKGKAFANSRKASGQFSRASTASKLIRTSLTNTMYFPSKREIHNRLLSVTRKLIGEAESPNYKKSKLNHLPWQQLNTFEFNTKKALNNLLYLNTGFEITLKKETGELKITIPSWKPSEGVLSVGGITHARIIISAAHIDFDKKKVTAKTTDSGFLPVKTKEVQAQDVIFQLSLQTAIKHPLFIALGIRSHQLVAQKYHELIGANNFGMIIIQVITPPPLPPKKKPTTQKSAAKKSAIKKTAKKTPATKRKALKKKKK
jgi:hypothetical protein